MNETWIRAQAFDRTMEQEPAQITLICYWHAAGCHRDLVAPEGRPLRCPLCVLERMAEVES